MSATLRQVLLLHWKTARWPLAPVIVAAFAIPLFVLRVIHTTDPRQVSLEPAALIHMQGQWSFVFPLLALTAGVMVALTAWSWDHQVRHVYALSLPVDRGRYSMLKFAAGMLILAIPVIALGLGTVAGLATVVTPDELNAYPLAFIARFALAAAVVYAATFAAASGTVRTTAIILVAFVVVVIMGSALVSILQELLHNYSLRTPVDLLYTALVRWPGPFNVFGGNWLIIDA